MEAVDALKRDVTATAGSARAAVVDRHAARLLPFDWPQDVLAAKLIDDVQQELHEAFVDTAWPHCPAHPNHPLWFEDAAWRCSDLGRPVAAPGDLEAVYFNDAIMGLRRGDFDRLAPLFRDRGDEPCLMLKWEAEGKFVNHVAERAEALSNACFLGRTEVVRAMTAAGVDVTAGTATGMDGIHWAVNRGRLETVRLLIALGAPLETINMHGTTTLGTAVWSAINEPKRDHLEIIGVLLEAGANVDAAEYPTGAPEIDALLRGYGAT